MKKIELLDCSLRDGGYINDWEFGYSTIIYMFERLVSANIDIIEIGFVDDRREFDPNRTIQPNTKCYDEIFKSCDKGNSLIVAMIDYGTCDIKNIAPCNESFIDGIRIIFKKPKMKDAIEFAKEVKKLGYKVFLQLVSITSYKDRDILDLVDLINDMQPCAVSMVDTYGLMHKEEMLHYFHLLERNLNQNITIGYHSHNNFQLGYSNEISMIKQNTERNLIVDGTVYGIGKSAGNAPLELLAMHLNENYATQYDIDQILEIIDVNVMKIYKEHYWGYSLLFFLAAANDCHPNYIDYLLKKHTLSIKSVNEIARNIDEERKLNYDKNYIEELYISYQKISVCEEQGINKLSSDLLGKSILLLGPGNSLATKKQVINKFISTNKPITISVNCIPDEYNLDYVFIGNSKRYSTLFNQFRNLENAQIIATSNISSLGKPFDYIVSYESVSDENKYITDNAFIMFLNALEKMNLQEIYVAGFDGFSDKTENYFDEHLEFVSDYEQLEKVNQAVKERLEEFKKHLDLRFLTESVYIN